MCGHHATDGTPIGHHHGDHDQHGHGYQPGKRSGRRIFRSKPHPLSRRAFLGNFGKGTMAMAVVSPAVLAACASDGPTDAVASVEQPTAAPSTVESEAQPTATDPTAVAEAPSEAATGEGDTTNLEPVSWARTNLGFVSAYVLVRGNTAAIVDTGVVGSATAIGETLGTLGLNYSDVAHVILTHKHGDHIGSITEVLAEAVNATAYVGEADLVSVPGDISGLVGGEDIFGFEMLPTPGHTAGHMAAIDHQAGLLVAGDAIFTEDGGVVEGPEEFFSNVPQSRDSIKAMAALTFNTLLVGHGDPLESGAGEAVAALAATL